MKKYLCTTLAILFLVWQGSAQAALSLVLTKGNAGAIPIALLPFSDTSGASQNVSTIISNDLKNSGRFNLTTGASQTDPNQVDLNYWRKQNVDDVIVGRVEQSGFGSYKVTFSLISVFQGQAASSSNILVNQSFTVSEAQLRQTAHRISDIIYQQLTGVRGIFSTKLAYVLVEKSGKHSSKYNLFVADEDGYNPRVLLTSSEPIMSPDWSPDGRQLALVLSSAPGNPDIYVMDLATHVLRRVTRSPAIDTEPTWSPDGHSLYFTSDRGGSINLWALREHGSGWRRAPRGPFQLTFGPKSYSGPLLAPDGRRLYFLGGAHQDELVEWHLRQQLYTPFLPALHPAEPDYAPRTGQLVYLDRSGRLWRARADGRHRRLLLDAPALRLSLAFPRWSPDGQWLAITGQYFGQRAQVYLLSAHGGAPHPLAPGWPDVRDGDWSPGSRRLVFSYVTRPSAASLPRQLALYDLRTHRITPLAGSQNLFLPRWSPDGREIAAVHGRGRNIRIYSFATRQWRLAAHGHLLGLPVWSPHGRYLYFQDLLSPGEPLFRLNVHGSAPPRQIANFSALLQSGIMRCALFGLAPDGRPLFSLTTSNTNIYAADLNLP